MAQYGNYAAIDRARIQEAKDELLEGMIETIRELAEQDDFWIVKRCDPGNPLNDTLTSSGNDCTVGWRIDIPHMHRDGHKPILAISGGEVIGTLP